MACVAVSQLSNPCSRLHIIASLLNLAKYGHKCRITSENETLVVLSKTRSVGVHLTTVANVETPPTRHVQQFSEMINYSLVYLQINPPHPDQIKQN